MTTLPTTMLLISVELQGGGASSYNTSRSDGVLRGANGWTKGGGIG